VICPELETTKQIEPQYKKINLPHTLNRNIPEVTDIYCLVYEETNAMYSEQQEFITGHIFTFFELINFNDAERYTFNFLYENHFSFRFGRSVYHAPVVGVW
jgi:hypothetical protein